MRVTMETIRVTMDEGRNCLKKQRDTGNQTKGDKDGAREERNAKCERS